MTTTASTPASDSVIAPQQQDKLVDIIGSIQTQVSKAATFAVDQVSDIAVTYVHYGMAYNTLVTLEWLSLLIASVWATCKFGYFNHKALDTWGNWKETRLAAAIVGSLAALFTTGGLFTSLGPTLLVWFAPKVWLLKELASMVKGM